LNVRTRRAGSVRVGIVGLPGRSAADCDPVVGDGFSVPVRWRGENGIETDGRAVQLRFELRAAELFGLEWI